MSHNYFVNNAGANENIRGLTAWIVWQKLNNATELTPTAAKKGYSEEITKAIDWAQENEHGQLMITLEEEKKKVNRMNAGVIADFIKAANGIYSEIKTDAKYATSASIAKANIATIRKNLNEILPFVANETRNALVIFRNMLDEVLNSGEAINPLRPLATGVLDTSGSDSMWTKMITKDAGVVCLSHPPRLYSNVNFHSSIGQMCEKLIKRKNAAYMCRDGKRCLIDSIRTPKGLQHEQESVKLQVHAAHRLLENLRCIWQFPEDTGNYNEGTYVVGVISHLLEVLGYGAKALVMRWAEEASEASPHHKPDMRVKVTVPIRDIESLEILFLESSRPKADVQKFLLDWVKLVRMGKDAHDRMLNTITKNRAETLRKSSEGREFLRQVGDIPILLIQVHCHEVKIAILDRPYCAYYQVRVLEKFTLSLNPIESPKELEDFVCRWLRLLEYLNKIDSKLQDLWESEKDLFFTRPDSSDAMSVDTYQTPRTPTHDHTYFYDINKF